MQAYAQIDVETSEPYSWFLPQGRQALEALAVPVANADDNTSPQTTIWILTQRQNATLWATSVLHWHSVTQRLMRALDIHNNDYDNASLELPFAVTYDQVVQSLQASLDRVHDTRAWQARLTAFEQAYAQHLTHVRKTAKKLGIPLVEVIVDGDAEQVEAKLQADLGQLGVNLSLSPNTNTRTCWDFDAATLDDDWQDFSFPF